MGKDKIFIKLTAVHDNATNDPGVNGKSEIKELVSELVLHYS
jgi:hypothetical protein